MREGFRAIADDALWIVTSVRRLHRAAKYAETRTAEIVPCGDTEARVGVVWNRRGSGHWTDGSEVIST